METEQDILNSLSGMINKGKEPIRLLKSIEEIEAWSSIPPYMVMLLTQADLLNTTCFEQDNFLKTQFLTPLRKNYLSKDGYARQQFKEAHQGIWDSIKPIVAGALPPQDTSNQIQRNK